MPKKRRTESDLATKAIQKAVGERLSAIREVSGLNQTEVSKLIGVEQTAWSKWENGKRKQDVLALVRFAARFKASLDFIYLGRPLGLHDGLLKILRLQFPDLIVEAPTDTPLGMDTARASYMAAIESEMAGRPAELTS